MKQKVIDAIYHNFDDEEKTVNAVVDVVREYTLNRVLERLDRLNGMYTPYQIVNVMRYET